MAIAERAYKDICVERSLLVAGPRRYKKKKRPCGGEDDNGRFDIVARGARRSIRLCHRALSVNAARANQTR